MLIGILGQVLKEIDVNKVVGEVSGALNHILKEADIEEKETFETQVGQHLQANGLHLQAKELIESFVQSHPEYQESLEVLHLHELVELTLYENNRSKTPLWENIMNRYEGSFLIPKIVLTFVEHLQRQEVSTTPDASDISCNLNELLKGLDKTEEETKSPQQKAHKLIDGFSKAYPMFTDFEIHSYLLTISTIGIDSIERNGTQKPLSELLSETPEYLIMKPEYLLAYVEFLKAEEMKEKVKTETDTSEVTNEEEAKLIEFINTLPSFEEFLSIFQLVVPSNEEDESQSKDSSLHSFDPFSDENTKDLETFPDFSEAGKLGTEAKMIEGIQIDNQGKTLTLDGMPFLTLVVNFYSNWGREGDAPMTGNSFKLHDTVKILLNAYRNSIADKQAQLTELQRLMLSPSTKVDTNDYLRKMDTLTSKIQADIDSFTSITEKINQIKELCEKY
ncbi:hypothetical protein [Rossellomorea marisflavi]|uniref:hypothetical protein n=1 Tax=Rossellomorea marisflavi TaxID=189381 RepID=UPI003F9FFE7C